MSDYCETCGLDKGVHKKCIGRADEYLAEIERLTAALEAETAEKVRVISERTTLLAENSILKKDADYAVDLQRIIEKHCRGHAIPPNLAKKSPHLADMLNRFLLDSVSTQQGKFYPSGRCRAHGDVCCKYCEDPASTRQCRHPEEQKCCPVCCLGDRSQPHKNCILR